MSIKKNISIYISILFTVIFAIASVVIYFLFSDFRTDEFESRLKDKALYTIKLLIEMKQIDSHLLNQLNQKSIHKLYDAKTLVFNNKFELIYSSLNDKKVIWSNDDLKYLKNHGSFFRNDNDNEVYGLHYDMNQQDYYAIVSARDNYGNRKLEYLFYLLLGSYIVFTSFAWFLTSKTVQQLLNPLDLFHNKIKSINERNLDSRIETKQKMDEIDLLANEFNQMLKRIDISYKKQQEFTSNASHELRTPLARLIVQLENKINDSSESEHSISFYKQILNDVNQLNELTNSLLILSKQDKDNQLYSENCRIDEIIIHSIELLSKQFHDFSVDFSFDEIFTLEILGNKSLLQIAIQNLLKNAYLYSKDKHAKITLYSDSQQLKITIINNGATISEADQKRLFEPFMRGENAKVKTGLGLGLRIVQRILIQHKATIKYAVYQGDLNSFEIIFPI